MIVDVTIALGASLDRERLISSTLLLRSLHVSTELVPNPTARRPPKKKKKKNGLDQQKPWFCLRGVEISNEKSMKINENTMKII